MLISWVCVLVMLAGLLLYLVPVSNTKITEIGRIMFWTGLAFTLWPMAQHVVRIGG
jgi:Na+/phosphate symporter